MHVPDVSEPIKFTSIATIWFLTIVFSALPFFVASRVKNTLMFFSAMNCLSGGVVLGAALSHMLPDAEGNFAAYWASYTGSADADTKKYPFASLIAAVGLITLMVIDRTLLGDGHSHSEVNASEQSAWVVNNTNSSTPQPTDETRLLAEETKLEIGYTDSFNDQMKHLSSNGKPSASAVSRAWIFMGALSVHSLFEGLGIGAEDSKSAFYSVLLAVVAHKCLEAFALGLSVYNARFSTPTTMALVTGYSFATPIGIACGIVISQTSQAQNLIAGILVSIAAGSFLYISLIEILPTELHKPKGKYLKLFCMIIGWAGMAILAYYA